MSKENFAVNPLADRGGKVGALEKLPVNKSVQKAATKAVDIWNQNNDKISANEQLKALYLKHK